MLWALLFTLLLPNEPAFVFQDLEKLAKRYIVDDDRKEEFLELRKNSEKSRIKFLNEKKKILKNFDKLMLSRFTTQAELDNLFKLKVDERTKILESELVNILRLRELIDENELNVFFENNKEKFKKHNKDKKKQENILNKNYNKAIKKVKSVVKTEPNQRSIIAIIDKINLASEIYIDSYYFHVANMNSFNYLKDFSIEKLKEDVNAINSANDKILELAIIGHFQIKDLTSPKEWSKLSKKINAFNF